jgi:uncharacterized protein (TIGR03435 family)
LRDGKRKLQNQTTAQLANFLRVALEVPVIDKTGLTGSYDFEFTLLARPRDNHDTRIEWARKVMLEELGLELMPVSGSEEVLVYKRAK